VGKAYPRQVGAFLGKKLTSLTGRNSRSPISDRLCNQAKKEDITVAFLYYGLPTISLEMRLDRDDKPEGMSDGL